MRTRRTRSLSHVLRGLVDLSNVLRLFMALWDLWHRHIVIQAGAGSFSAQAGG